MQGSTLYRDIIPNLQWKMTILEMQIRHVNGNPMMPKELISKKDNIIIYSVLGSPMFALLAFVLYTTFSGPGSEELMMRDALSADFKGRVDSMYFDQRNHNGKYAILNNGQLYPIYRNWERNIEVGDSLYKQKGTFLVEIYKKNKTQITLNYLDTYKENKSYEGGWNVIIKEPATLNFSGAITSTYRAKNDHNAKMVVLKDGYTYAIGAEWEGLVEVGDSLSKKRGSLDVVVYKKNNSKIILNYQTLGKSRGLEFN